MPKNKNNLAEIQAQDLCGTPSWWIIARASDTTTCDMNALEREIRATATTAQNIVVSPCRRRSTGDIRERQSINGNTVGRFTSRSSIEVILLNINPVDRYTRESDILIDDICDRSCGPRVGFDSATILAVRDLGIGEGDPIDCIIRLSTNGANAQAMAPWAGHPGYSDVATTSNSHAVILIQDSGVRENQIGGWRNVQTIRVVSSWKASTYGVGCITSRVVENKTGNSHEITFGNVEAVDGPVLNVQVLDGASNHFIEHNEVIRPRSRIWVSWLWGMYTHKRQRVNAYLLFPPFEPFPSQ